MDTLNKYLKRILICFKFYNRQRSSNVWLFGEWLGHKCSDNSLYLANYIAKNDPLVNVVWSCRQNTDISLLDKKIKVIYFDDKETLEIYKKAGVVVMNEGFADFSADGYDYFQGAYRVNLWHGVAWKKIGLDMQKTKLKRFWKKVLMKFHPYSGMLANSDIMAKIQEQSFCVKPENMIKAGYPRNTIFFDDDTIAECRYEIYSLLQETFPFSLENIKIITYMPTFRDGTNNIFSFSKIADNEQLQKILEKHNAVIIERMHLVTEARDRFRNKKINNGRIIHVDKITSQRLLAATDLLITDYSSCFFDYLNLDRPVIHYLYDYKYYKGTDRGLYYSVDEVAGGACAYSFKELLNYIEMYLINPEQDSNLRKDRRQKFLQYDNPNACEDIYRTIMNRVSNLSCK